MMNDLYQLTNYWDRSASNILMRQRGTKIHPGTNMGIGKDDTFFAKADGIVRFEQMGKYRKKFIVYPQEQLAKA